MRGHRGQSVREWGPWEAVGEKAGAIGSSLRAGAIGSNLYEDGQEKESVRDRGYGEQSLREWGPWGTFYLKENDIESSL